MGLAATAGVANIHTQKVGDFVASLTLEAVPRDVVQHAQWDILDSIGCALFGQTLPIAAILERAQKRVSSGGNATVWGTAWKASADTAALINGTLVHSFELDDLHHEAILHPGGMALSPALALAEAEGGTGADVVVAHVAGLEVSSRVGLAVGVPLLRRGWHNNGILGIFASAAASSRVLRLDGPQVVHAIGTAGSLAAGLMAAQFGAMVKRMHAGHAAASGMRAAVLASEGFTGIEALFEHGYGGFFPTFADSYETGEVSAELGERWETLNVGFKQYSCCGSSHTTVDILRGLRASRGLRAEQVKGITITGSSATRDHVGWEYVPDSTTTAQMNLPYAAAVALIDGECFVDQFAEDRLRDPEILDLVGRIKVEADPAIDEGGRTRRHEVRVHVDLHDGGVIDEHAIYASGSVRNPLSPDQLRQKFLRLASKRVSSDQAERILDAVMSLDTAPDVSRLTDALTLH